MNSDDCDLSVGIIDDSGTFRIGLPLIVGFILGHTVVGAGAHWAIALAAGCVTAIGALLLTASVVAARSEEVSKA